MQLSLRLSEDMSQPCRSKTFTASFTGIILHKLNYIICRSLVHSIFCLSCLKLTNVDGVFVVWMIFLKESLSAFMPGICWLRKELMMKEHNLGTSISQNWTTLNQWSAWSTVTRVKLILILMTSVMIRVFLTAVSGLIRFLFFLCLVKNYLLCLCNRWREFRIFWRRIKEWNIRRLAEKKGTFSFQE